MDPLPGGDGHPVLVYPGFGVSGAATTELRTRLLQLGYQVYDWELGVGMWPPTCFDTWLQLMANQLQRIRRAHGRAASLVGWSLGGLFARELAKLCPHEVRQVITLGTPFGGGLKAADLASLDSLPVDALPHKLADPALIERLQQAPPVPSASIYSKTDGLVAWERCVDPQLPESRNIEVRGVSHFGLVHHPDVLRVVAQLLAEPCATHLSGPALS
jgi:pimeloyl-ACP methyl ester carboxylesterase